MAAKKQPGRVAGSGKNTPKKMVDGLPSRRNLMNWRGSEGPKKSSPAKRMGAEGPKRSSKRGK
jgi:hypothetical protein